MRTLLISPAPIRRLIRGAAAALLAGVLLAGGPVLADGHGHDHGGVGSHQGEGGGHEGGWRGDGGRGGHEGGWQGGGEGWRGGHDGGARGGGEGWRGGRQWIYGPPPGYPGPRSYPAPYPGPPPRSYAPPYAGMAISPRRAPQPGPGLRRGGLIPPQYRGAIVPDYGRHRLRPPPPGFAWVRMGDRYMLVSRTTGQIFDVIGP